MTFLISNGYDKTTREERKETNEIIYFSETLFDIIQTLDTNDECLALGAFVKKVRELDIENKQTEAKRQYAISPDYFMRYLEGSFEHYLDNIKGQANIEFINEPYKEFQLIARARFESFDSEKGYGRQYKDIYLLKK